MRLLRNQYGIYAKENIPEFIFSFFMLMFSLVKPITQPTGYNGIFLFFISLFCVVYLLRYNKVKKIAGNYRFLCEITACIVFVLLFDALFRYGEQNFQYIYDFCLYGIIPIFFVSNVRDYKSVLWFYSIFSVINGMIYLFDPFQEYSISGGYMPFGFNVMMPAIVGSTLLFFYFKKKIALLLLLFFLLFSFIFSNKGATLSGLFIVIFAYVYIPAGGRLLKRRLAIVSLILCMGLFFFLPLLDIAWSVVSHMNIEGSYALTTVTMITEGLGDNVYSERFKVWADAITMFNDSRLWGHGVGHFYQYSEQPYPHNFILQIMTEYGIAGTLLFLFIFVSSLKQVFRIHSFEKKIFVIIMFVMWFIPLSISLSYWTYMPFWIYWATCFISNKTNTVYGK